MQTHGVTDAAIGTAPWRYNWHLKQRADSGLVAYSSAEGCHQTAAGTGYGTVKGDAACVAT
jgi:hypothetical protein